MAAPRIIDTDTHFPEPPDLWEGKLPASWSDVTMKVRWDDEMQKDVWMIGERIIGPAWVYLQYGFSDEHQFGEAPATLEDVHPATYVQSERVALMDQEGVRAQVLYPNLAGLRLDQFVEMPSADVAIAHTEVYNDYQLEWALNYPGRFIPMLVVPFWDVRASLREIERLKGKGFGGVVMTGMPQIHGQPYLGDSHWNPLWESVQDAGLSVSFHVGSGDNRESTSAERTRLDPPGTSLPRISTGAILDNAKQVTDLVLCGVLYRYPDLRFVSVESGLAWIPAVLESMDYHYARDSRGVEELPFGELRPSDLFRRQVYANFWFEELPEWKLRAVGDRNVLFETDFPHPTCLEPVDVEERLEWLTQNLPQDVVERILWGNALDLYGVALEELEKGASGAR